MSSWGISSISKASGCCWLTTKPLSFSTIIDLWRLGYPQWTLIWLHGNGIMPSFVGDYPSEYHCLLFMGVREPECAPEWKTANIMMACVPEAEINGGEKWRCLLRYIGVEITCHCLWYLLSAHKSPYVLCWASFWDVPCHTVFLSYYSYITATQT